MVARMARRRRSRRRRPQTCLTLSEDGVVSNKRSKPWEEAERDRTAERVRLLADGRGPGGVPGAARGADLRRALPLWSRASSEGAGAGRLGDPWRDNPGA